MAIMEDDSAITRRWELKTVTQLGRETVPVRLPQPWSILFKQEKPRSHL